jgi:hypothetical protein
MTSIKLTQFLAKYSISHLGIYISAPTAETDRSKHEHEREATSWLQTISHRRKKHTAASIDQVLNSTDAGTTFLVQRYGQPAEK